MDLKSRDMDSIVNSGFVKMLTRINIHILTDHIKPYHITPKLTTPYQLPVEHDEVLNHLELLFVKELLLEAPVCLVLKPDILALLVAEPTDSG